MIPFRAPLDDIMASLRRFGGLQAEAAETTGAVLEHFAAFAEAELAPLNAIGDAQGCRMQGGRVLMPPGFATAWRRMAADGWAGLTAPEAFGGQASDPLTAAGVTEIFAGANHALQMITGLVPGAIATLLRYGSPAQQAEWIPALAAGDWLSTMCLTEPGAGSDLGRITCRARRDGDHWRLDGEKIFISGGDQDLSTGVLHLVLARTGPADSGTRGLSLFLCPASGDGARNGVTVTRIEEKLGLHASPTCQLVFDNAQAELVGVEGQGLAAMFTQMNHARIDVALQGVAHAARAHAIADAYANTRQQGRRADGQPAHLANHADIRRMLDKQRQLALGARAMCHLTLAQLQSGAGRELADILTSVSKVFATEAGIRAADLGIQILGGYGYLTEYGVAQIWRDARVTAIYEGTNGIHALGLATRGIRAGAGRGAADFAELLRGLGYDGPELTAWQAAAARLQLADDPAAQAHEFATQTTDLLFQAVSEAS